MIRKSKQPIEIQRQKAIRRIGANDPRCVACGENDPLCLELHHIAGRKFDDPLVIICRNCHRILSAHQKDHPQEIRGRKSLLESIGHFLLGLADLLALAVTKLREFGRQLIDEARAVCADPKGNAP